MNVEKLKDVIADRGLKLQFVASSLNLTRAGLYNKMRGKSEFNLKEIRAIEKTLNLSEKEVIEIFFNQNSDY